VWLCCIVHTFRFSIAGQSACTRCAAGRFVSGAYPATLRTAFTACLICPAGYYCPFGQVINFPVTATDSSMILCPPGTFNVNEGQSDISACVSACPSGRYSTVGGATSVAGANCQVCGQGYYCVGGGTLWPGSQSTQIPCPPGTFGAASGLVSVAACTPCPAGSYTWYVLFAFKQAPLERGWPRGQAAFVAECIIVNTASRAFGWTVMCSLLMCSC
jgi:hypothetical protein